MKLVIINNIENIAAITISKHLYDSIQQDAITNLTKEQFLKKYGTYYDLILCHIDEFPTKYIESKIITTKLGNGKVEIDTSFVCFAGYEFKTRYNNIIPHEDAKSSKLCLKSFINPFEFVLIYKYKNNATDILKEGDFWRDFNISYSQKREL